MTRTFRSFPVSDIQLTKLRILEWCSQFNVCCFLDSNQYTQFQIEFECLAAAGSVRDFTFTPGTSIQQLKNFCNSCHDWLFGHVGYDFKNELENSCSPRLNGVNFPDLAFFIPETIVYLSAGSVTIGVFGTCHDIIYNTILGSQLQAVNSDYTSGLHLNCRVSREEYIEKVMTLQRHIVRGDCYEINYCQEFYSEDAMINPLLVYKQLSHFSPNPFAVFYRLNNRYALCASPERFLKRKGDKIISQPMKGTAPRFPGNSEADTKSREQLASSAKERAENIMIVDLVRNDLSRICEEGSVSVEELCSIYSFPYVHQMISTVRGIVNKDIDWVDVIRAAFPMGSMTGAPKKRVMDLIDTYEASSRGLFSGSIGYIDPGGDFDFNVVIRTILYDAASRYLSYHTGSAITFYSDPLLEYSECLVKGEAIKKVLTGSVPI